MQIKTFEAEYLNECAQILVKAYNSAPWDNHWNLEIAERYLSEFIDSPRFAGFVLLEDAEVAGAAFCHEKTWWTNDELYVDEFFISPEHQRKGYGKALLEHIGGYIKEKKLAGFTLLTDRSMPAVDFYESNGFVKGEHVVFMYKVVR